MEILHQSENLTLKELYDLTRSPEAEGMKDHIGETLKLDAYMVREETNDEGEVITIASVKSGDKIYSTNSATFVREFSSILVMAKSVNAKVNHIKVTSGQSKKGREYITCVYID